MRKFLISVSFAIAALFSAAQASDIMIMSATATASPTPKARNGAAYLAIMNHGAETDALVGVTADVSEVAEIHQSTNENNVMKMRAVERLEIAAGATLDLKAEGMHIMLVGLKAPLKTGDRIALELQFEKAGMVKVEAEVGGVATGEHDHGD
jgi:periplasmic copper chaperone A